ncbi:hypothetical protein K435DRAFT_190663 [Dendrothele bispora CBS 962.96]|uniref:Uncharacterized protein n=1 Tax=Dendrothele bispora (strain CBS 962.96) TaxID=1314807 RepID=A0A4S8LVQ4_DENBC|nr:hypothetical protein K435DRAFT_190663 [Dendrothele bispora CBS 962.96]
MDALVSSSSPRRSSFQFKSMNQYMSNDDPESFPEPDSYDPHSIPPRPTSRLGFHDMGGSFQDPANATKSHRSHSRSRSATFKWTRSLFQKMGFDSSSSLSVNDSNNVGDDHKLQLNVNDIGQTVIGASSSTPSAHGDGDEETSTTTTLSPRAVPTSPSLSCSSLENLPLDDISFTLSSSGSDSDSDSDMDVSDSDLDLDSLLDMGVVDDPREPQQYRKRSGGSSFRPPTSITAIAATSFCTISDNTPSASNSHLSASHSTSTTAALSDELETPSPSFHSAATPSASQRLAKYTCLPSPLSPSSSTSYIPAAPQFPPARHDYDHHGHSLHSLRHQRWFWSVREEAWAEYAAYVNGCKAYAGIDISDDNAEEEAAVSLEKEKAMDMFPALFWKRSCSSEGKSGKSDLGIDSSLTATDGTTTTTLAYSQQTVSTSSSSSLSLSDIILETPLVSGTETETEPEPEPEPPITLHPRWGDLATLRDAWCVHLDRYFVGLPLWSIRKAFWMVDLHQVKPEVRRGGRVGSGRKSEKGGRRRSRWECGSDGRPHRDLEFSGLTGDGDGDDDDDDDHTETTDTDDATTSDCIDEFAASVSDEDVSFSGDLEEGRDEDDDEDDGEEEEDDFDGNSMRMSMLTGFSDDSDVTLVDADGDEDGQDQNEHGNENDDGNEEDQDISITDDLSSLADLGNGSESESASTPTVGFDVDAEEEEFFEDVCLEESDRDRRGTASEVVHASTSTSMSMSSMNSSSSSSLCYLASSSSSSSSHLSTSAQTQMVSKRSGLEAYFASEMEWTPSTSRVKFSYMPLDVPMRTRSSSSSSTLPTSSSSSTSLVPNKKMQTQSQTRSDGEKSFNSLSKSKSRSSITKFSHQHQNRCHGKTKGCSCALELQGSRGQAMQSQPQMQVWCEGDYYSRSEILLHLMKREREGTRKSGLGLDSGLEVRNEEAEKTLSA